MPAVVFQSNWRVHHVQPHAPVRLVTVRYRYYLADEVGLRLFAGDSLSQVKLGILNFSAAAELAPQECMLLYLVAAADPDDAVAKRGEELSKKR